MISNVTRENLLVAKGNYALLAVDTPLYQTDGSISLMPGQLGIFSSKTHKALSAGTVAAQDNIYIAIGMDMDGDGVSDQIRKVAGENLNKRQISKVSQNHLVVHVLKSKILCLTVQIAVLIMVSKFK